jgi:hypothetical protein
MTRLSRLFTAFGIVLGLTVGAPPADAQWVTRDHRWPPRGAWNWASSEELPQLFREFNGIDFGHAQFAAMPLLAQDPEMDKQ